MNTYLGEFMNFSKYYHEKFNRQYKKNIIHLINNLTMCKLWIPGILNRNRI